MEKQQVDSLHSEHESTNILGTSAFDAQSGSQYRTPPETRIECSPLQLQPKSEYPYEGTIHGAWSVALRETPEKDENNPHKNTLADVPKGEKVTVYGKSGGWLEVTWKGFKGYISQELVIRGKDETSSPKEPSQPSVSAPSPPKEKDQTPVNETNSPKEPPQASVSPANSPNENAKTPVPDKKETVPKKDENLKSPRFSKMIDLEAVLDGKKTLQEGDSGRGVQAIQQCLYDLGYSLPTNGASGTWDAETTKALKSFQSDRSLTSSGNLNKETIKAFDKRFGALKLVDSENDAKWTAAGVKKILKPWSPHTIETLKTKIKLASFDEIFWTDKEWNGKAWIPKKFPGGGYNTGTEIGILNETNEKVANTLYHEVLHANQPSSQNTTLEKESYAYRIGEEFSIAAGIGGHTELRNKDDQGREYADQDKVDKFVKKEYPSVSSKAPGEQIIKKVGNKGKIRVQKPDGTIYVRMAEIGEMVPGPMTIKGKKEHDQSIWN